MTTADELLDYIFAQDKTNALAQDFARWVRESRRFKAFAETYRDKIKRKYRLVRDDDSLKDLRCELETAALLLHEARFTLEYEKYAALRQRGPDFTVTFKTHTPFNVEVRRVRKLELDEYSTEARVGKLMGVVCDKVGQMPPSIVNLLWMASEDDISDGDLSGAVTTLRLLAERKTEDYFLHRGFASAVDFLKQFRHLSAIALRQQGANIFWVNAIARHKLPPDIQLILQRLPT